jgi:hypothetical protein
VVATQPWPAVDDEQSAHAAPDAPHADGAVPGWHIPLAQQAPLHGWVALHAVTHASVLASHAEPAGQSAALEQPQVPPVCPGTHAEPMLFALQSRQAPPLAPHAVLARPATHEPAWQQPPLHAL